MKRAWPHIAERVSPSQRVQRTESCDVAPQKNVLPGLKETD